MLTPQELLQIVDTMHPLLDNLNEWITNDLIARLMARLGRGEELLLTGTDEWQVQVYQSAGGHLEALQLIPRCFLYPEGRGAKLGWCSCSGSVSPRSWRLLPKCPPCSECWISITCGDIQMSRYTS